MGKNPEKTVVTCLCCIACPCADLAKVCMQTLSIFQPDRKNFYHTRMGRQSSGNTDRQTCRVSDLDILMKMYIIYRVSVADFSVLKTFFISYNVRWAWSIFFHFYTGSFKFVLFVVWTMRKKPFLFLLKTQICSDYVVV